MKVRMKRIEIALCQNCLDGRDGECAVPECALCRHPSIEFPIMPEMYKVLKEWETEA